MCANLRGAYKRAPVFLSTRCPHWPGPALGAALASDPFAPGPSGVVVVSWLWKGPGGLRFRRTKKRRNARILQIVCPAAPIGLWPACGARARALSSSYHCLLPPPTATKISCPGQEAGRAHQHRRHQLTCFTTHLAIKSSESNARAPDPLCVCVCARS